VKTALSFLAFTCLALALVIGAEKSEGEHSLQQFRLGAHLFGPPPTSMQGKAVLLDCWGIHCGPCLAMMPEVERISKQYGQRLVVVGVHSQENDRPAIEAVVKKNHLSYSIVNGVSGPVKFEMLPHVFIFDSSGEMIFSGSPFDNKFKPSLTKAVNSVSAAAAATPSGLDMLKQMATPAPIAPIPPIEPIAPIAPAAAAPRQ